MKITTIVGSFLILVALGTLVLLPTNPPGPSTEARSPTSVSLDWKKGDKYISLYSTNRWIVISAAVGMLVAGSALVGKALKS